MQIFKAGDAHAVELTRKDGTWTVAERTGYPADEAKLRKLLRGLADAKVLEEKTSNPSNYKSLGVEDLTEGSATGLRVELEGAANPVNLIVGKSGPGARSHYVRRAGEPQSWLIDASIDSSASPDAWLRKDVVDVSADRIQSARVNASGKPYTAAKAARADANFSVADLPRGKQLSSPAAANGVATALAGLTLSDVRSAATLDTAPNAQATFTTFDGLVVQLDGWIRDDKRFVTLKTSHDPKVAERFKIAATPADGKSAAKDEKAAAQPPEAKAPDVAAETASINARTQGWAYEIASYKYEQIFKPLDELL